MASLKRQFKQLVEERENLMVNYSIASLKMIKDFPEITKEEFERRKEESNDKMCSLIREYNKAFPNSRVPMKELHELLLGFDSFGNVGHIYINLNIEGDTIIRISAHRNEKEWGLLNKAGYKLANYNNRNDHFIVSRS